ncbi:MAG TPA: SCO family protein [Tepidisphaeraceae bacterium]|nr:SCO family protein [Tepidisphaeraceae bacterium]
MPCPLRRSPLSPILSPVYREEGAKACRALVACVVLFVFATTARAQDPIRQQPAAASMMTRVGIDQNLNAQLPLDLEFRDESGKTVRLGQYFGEKPVVLAFVYYGCPSLCTMVLNGMNQSFRTLSFDIGKEYDVVTVSFDHTETPQLAAEKKATYLRQYGRAGGEQGWHFLTGDEANIQKLTKAAGFRFVWDDATKQFAHGSAIMVTTPDGRLSRYFYGLEYAPKDLRLGLIEASQNRIGGMTDQVLLLCYQYNPMTGKYGFAIMRSLQAGGIATLLALVSYITMKLVRERRDARRRALNPQPAGNAPRGEVDPGHAGSDEQIRAGRCPRAIKV